MGTVQRMDRNSTQRIETAALPQARLAYSKNELSQLLGLSPVTLWRLEKKGLLRPVAGVRHKLYSAHAVARFLEGRAA